MTRQPITCDNGTLITDVNRPVRQGGARTGVMECDAVCLPYYFPPLKNEVLCVRFLVGSDGQSLDGWPCASRVSPFKSIHRFLRTVTHRGFAL